MRHSIFRSKGWCQCQSSSAQRHAICTQPPKVGFLSNETFRSTACLSSMCHSIFPWKGWCQCQSSSAQRHAICTQHQTPNFHPARLGAEINETKHWKGYSTSKHSSLFPKSEEDVEQNAQISLEIFLTVFADSSPPELLVNKCPWPWHWASVLSVSLIHCLLCDLGAIWPLPGLKEAKSELHQQLL